MKVILASSSERRKELLKYIFDDFIIINPNIDEVIDQKYLPEEMPEVFAIKKGKEVSKDNFNSLVIAADTAVFVNGIMLGKPKDKNDAYTMLSMLSGKVHSVITGVFIGYEGRSISFSNETFVEFYPMSNDQINEYIETNDPFDKAGGYGIQGKASKFVKRIDGDFFNVVGLPVGELNNVLEKFLNFRKG